MKVVVLGQGYVGLPLAQRAVQVGHEVVGFDVDEAKVARLCAGDSYVSDISSADLDAMLATGQYWPSSQPMDLTGFEVAVITVPTPLRAGMPDLSAVESAASMLGPHVRPGCTVVLESTTYPGTTEQLVVPILEDASGLIAGVDFAVGYSPELIDPGNRRWTFVNTPKLVSGYGPKSLDTVQNFYGQLVDSTVPVSDPKVAEFAKVYQNTFRLVQLAFVQEMARLAHGIGVDIWEALDAAGAKPFGRDALALRPSAGVGGHCIGVDPEYLSHATRSVLGQHSDFVALAMQTNNAQPNYVVHRLMEGLNRRGQAMHGARVLVLGLAYKAGSADLRESPALKVIRLLAGHGAEVVAADPHVAADIQIDGLAGRVELTADELVTADAVVLVTDHAEFDYELVAARAGYVLDCRNRVPASPAVERL